MNWKLAFDEYKESETTKHVHRIHPYKGKFIPQLVEYFLNQKTDDFKKDVIFKSNDVVLDPFCGSGTTLVQSNEMSINAVGIDVSKFNAQICNVKLTNIKKKEIERFAKLIEDEIDSDKDGIYGRTIDNEMSKIIHDFNDKYFPSNYKRKIATGKINESEYSKTHEMKFMKIYDEYQKNNKIKNQKAENNFMSKWYLSTTLSEINAANKKINEINNDEIKNIMNLILSRTIRSCRATSHYDLTTLKEVKKTPYYCHKHGKICKPIYSILKWWKRYSKDTANRIDSFQNIKTNTEQFCIAGDSQTIDILKELPEGKLLSKIKKDKINGIFSSPPYIGLINYHEQHAYAYELFNMKRKDHEEIGILEKGTSAKAKEEYIKGISNTLINSKKFMIDNFNVLLVANDKFNLYPEIAKRSNMKIIAKYKRPVLNRAESSKTAYTEIIFHLKPIN